MPQELAKKERRGGARPGAGRRALGKIFVKAYLPASLVSELEAKAASSGRPKGKLVEEAVSLFLHLSPKTKKSKSSPPPPDPLPDQDPEIDLPID